LRVARSTTTHQVVVEELPDPTPGSGEVVCRVLACGVCGSDVSDGYVTRKLPCVLGHEVVGEVLEIGAGVASVSVGDRVVVHHHAPCGACRTCRRGHETLCVQYRATKLAPGGFAEKVLVEPALVPELLPLGTLDPIAATFVEPLGCVLRALDRAGLQAGDELLVVGAGSNGLLAIATARARGAGTVWIREPRAERRALAEAWGARPHADELVDVAFLTTASDDAITTAASALGPGGVLCLYATTKPGAALGVDAELLFLRELTICSSWSAGPADMRAAYTLLASGEIDPLPLVTHRLGLDDTARALDLQRRGEAIKAVVMP
jgi:L-iditol 2-dehydrogenase